MRITPEIATLYDNSTAEQRRQLAVDLGMTRARLRGAISEYHAATSRHALRSPRAESPERDDALHFANLARQAKANIAGGLIAIDPPIRTLVDAINRFPSLCTAESGMRHEDTGVTQSALGSFYLCFYTAPTLHGYDDLEWLLLALHGYARHHMIRYKLEATPEDGMLFWIEGEAGESADNLANWLGNAWAMSKHGPYQDIRVQCSKCEAQLSSAVALYHGQTLCDRCL